MRVILCILSLIGMLEASRYNNYIYDIKRIHRPILRRSHSINFPYINETCTCCTTNLTTK